MGTSSIRSAPSNLRGAKTVAGRYAQGQSSPGRAISSYIRGYGGADAIRDSRIVSAGGQALKKAPSAAHAFAGLLNDIKSRGLEQTLHERGLAHLIGKPPSEVIAGIIDSLLGLGEDLPESILRAAEAEIFGELFDGPITTYDDLAKSLQSNLDQKEVLDLTANLLAEVAYQAWLNEMSEKLEKNAPSGQVLNDREIQVRDILRELLHLRISQINQPDLDLSSNMAKQLIEEAFFFALKVTEDLR